MATLVSVFDRLLDAGATIIVIDHDLDLLSAADHIIDMGPGGGPDGGRIVATGTPEDVARSPDSVTGPWLAEYLGISEAGPRCWRAEGYVNEKLATSIATQMSLGATEPATFPTYTLRRVATIIPSYST